ncbi:hypothetical protein Glove_529g25 [Diversispora epigaea]|uniref:AAA-ATPase-like domain-containing protein n=1 Tax=Diversispora epigaea TaxID=1348612 RepID=A0A397GDN6_9GLOM|nr:hypothetical protein Glove_529g25 [Diversispora epigaea]
MLESYYDIKNKECFEQLFGNLYIGKNPTKLASSFLVLKFNFSGLRTNEACDIFNANFHMILNSNMTLFMNRYKKELGCHFQDIDIKDDALGNFEILLNAVQLSDHKYVCDKGIARIFQTGITPVIMSEFTSGFNISEDITLNKKFWDMYGFKKSKIELLLNKTFGNRLQENIKEELIKRNFLKQKEKLNNSWNSLTIRDAFFNFPSDPQTLLSQISLELIVNNPTSQNEVNRQYQNSTNFQLIAKKSA